MSLGRAIAACGWLLVLSCSEQASPEFPVDYAANYVEVRDCRASADHDLNNIRILADPAALPIYVARDAAFPVGAVVLKEEYDFADVACSGPIKQWTAMRWLDGTTNGGWAWQRVGADRTVVSTDEVRCINCHAQCGRPPDGYEGTCAVP